jgi:hypothetical protein
MMDPSPSLIDNSLHHQPLPEEYGEYGATFAEAEFQGPMLEANPFGGMPTLSHFNAGHDPMAPPVHQDEPSQSQSAAHVHQPTSAASPVTPNQGVVEGPDPNIWCFICEKDFHAKKALNRHIDDLHSEEKPCNYTSCSFTCKGKRKMRKHLEKVHDVPLTTRPRRRKVAVPDSMPPQLPESESESESESASTPTYTFVYESQDLLHPQAY